MSSQYEIYDIPEIVGAYFFMITLVTAIVGGILSSILMVLQNEFLSLASNIIHIIFIICTVITAISILLAAMSQGRR